MTDNEDWRVSREDEDPLVKSARSEMAVVLGYWVVFALWTVLTCWKLGYNADVSDPATMKLMMGMPLWVFWGIAVPWVASIAFTIWFALGFMKDHDLDRDNPDEADSIDKHQTEVADHG